MSSSEPPQAPAGPVRDVPVDWEALEDAFENNAPEVHSYLHLATGDVLRVVDGVADPSTLITLQDTADGQADITFSQLHRHFRKFNVVYDPAGKPLFFRYYDPRVLIDVLSAFETDQLNAFFGPVDAVLVIDPERQVKRCRRQAGKLEIQA